MGGVQVTVSWSTDVLVTAMFLTEPGEAGRDRRSCIKEQCSFLGMRCYGGLYDEVYVTIVTDRMVSMGPWSLMG